MAEEGAGRRVGVLAGYANRLLWRSKVVEAPETVFTLLHHNDERLGGSAPCARRIDHDACDNASVREALDPRHLQDGNAYSRRPTKEGRPFPEKAANTVWSEETQQPRNVTRLEADAPRGEKLADGRAFSRRHRVASGVIGIRVFRGWLAQDDDQVGWAYRRRGTVWALS
jgi:hypothetical protein